MCMPGRLLLRRSTGVTGELVQAKLTSAHDHIRDWLLRLPGPVAVAYEAGPTGFGLYRALTGAGSGAKSRHRHG